MITTAGLTLQRVQQLYEEYATDLVRVRRYMRLLHTDRFDAVRERQRATLLYCLANDLNLPFSCGTLTSAQFDDIAGELTYLLLRQERPETVVEMSPCGGWSTAWILNALHDNGCGRLVSFDLHDTSVAKVPPDLAAGIRTFHLGDVRQSPHMPDAIDFLFVDSDHTAPFAHWYLESVVPRVRSGGVVIVDDVFQLGGVAESGGEGPVVLDWLKQRGIDYFTAARGQNSAGYAAIKATKQRLGLGEPVVGVHGVDPAIYFTMP